LPRPAHVEGRPDAFFGGKVSGHNFIARLVAWHIKKIYILQKITYIYEKKRGVEVAAERRPDHLTINHAIVI